MKTYGRIEITDHHNVFGKLEKRDFKWIGESHEILIWAYSTIAKYDEKTIKYGPYILRIIDTNPLCGEIHCVRLDYPFWWFIVFMHRIGSVFRLTGARIVVTLAVWRLADFSDGYIPNINDIHAIQKIKKLFGENK